MATTITKSGSGAWYFSGGRRLIPDKDVDLDDQTFIDDKNCYDIIQGYRFQLKLSLLINLLKECRLISNIFVSHHMALQMKGFIRRVYRLKVKNTRKYKNALPTINRVNTCIDLVQLNTYKLALSYNIDELNSIISYIEEQKKMVIETKIARAELVNNTNKRIQVLKMIGVEDDDITK